MPLTKKKFYLVLKQMILSVFLLSCAYQQEQQFHSSSCSQTKRFFSEVEQKYSVFIDYEDIGKTFPGHWLISPNNAKVEPLDLTQDLTQVKRALQSALVDYPQSVLDGSLRSIGLANKMFFYDYFFSGVYSKTFPKKNSIYLSVYRTKEITELYTYIQGKFHSEFSSILMHKYPFPEEKWREVNPENFKYRFESIANPGLEAIRQGLNEVDETGAYYSQGFLKTYALAGIEQDFNVYSEVALTFPEGILYLAKEHPIIMKKLKIWIDFYLSIDPSFAEKPTFKYLIRNIN